jgi:hypothetical protein
MGHAIALLLIASIIGVGLAILTDEELKDRY